MRLRFPREISYFRSAYQNQTASQRTSSTEIPVPQAAAVALNPEEIGTDDDAALPYAGAQTPATQEAVMVGILSELNKHHTKFTILYASDPLDQVFLARYLRTKYPRGRVVVTDPDLLLLGQEDSSLRGVLGISSIYPIVPGMNDTFCSFQPSGPPQNSTSSHGSQDSTSGKTSVPPRTVMMIDFSLAVQSIGVFSTRCSPFLPKATTPTQKRRIPRKSPTKSLRRPWSGRRHTRNTQLLSSTC